MIQTTSFSSGTGAMQILQFFDDNDHTICRHICTLLLMLYLNIMIWMLFKLISNGTYAIWSMVDCCFHGCVDTINMMQKIQKNTEISCFCRHLVCLVNLLKVQHSEHIMDINKSMFDCNCIIKAIYIIVTLLAALGKIIKALSIVFVVWCE